MTDYVKDPPVATGAIAVAVDQSGQAYESSQSLPSNFQSFYGSFATAITGVDQVYNGGLSSSYWLYYNRIAFAACQAIIAP